MGFYFEASSALTDEQVELLRLLWQHLLPTETFSKKRLGDLVVQAAHADTLWNRQTQHIVS